MGMITFSFNKDKNSVKKSFQWLMSLILGGTDNVEGEEVALRLKELRAKRELKKELKAQAKHAKKFAKKASYGLSASESCEKVETLLK